MKHARSPLEIGVFAILRARVDELRTAVVAMAA